MTPATSHTVALIRMGEDGKITYGGDKTRIRELVSKLVAEHCNGFVVTGLSIEQLARKIAERGEAIEMMQELCETMGCTLRVDPSADDDPQFVLSRDARHASTP
jgi:hypothetical protein